MTTGAIEKATADKAAAPATVSPKQQLTSLLDRNRDAVGASLPSGMSVDRFMRLLLTATNQNRDLLACTPNSFLAAAVTSAQLGLEPNDPRGLAYLIPFKNKGVKEVQFIIGYRGLLDLARRSGRVSSIQAFAVFKGDQFDYRLGLDPTIEHVPNEDSDQRPEDMTHVYAVAKVQGDPQFVVLTRKQIERTKASSQGGKSPYSPWNSGYYVEMAKKTALRALCKTLPLSVEAARADSLDGRALRLDASMLTDDPLSTVTHDDDDVIDVDSSEDGDGDGTLLGDAQ